MRTHINDSSRLAALALALVVVLTTFELASCN